MRIVVKDICVLAKKEFENPDLICDEADLTPEDWTSSRIILYKSTIEDLIENDGDDMSQADLKILVEAVMTNAEWFMIEE